MRIPYKKLFGFVSVAGVSGFAKLVGNGMLGGNTVSIASLKLLTCAGVVFGRSWSGTTLALYFYYYTKGGGRIYMWQLYNANNGSIQATIASDNKTISFSSENLDEIFSLKFE